MHLPRDDLVHPWRATAAGGEQDLAVDDVRRLHRHVVGMARDRVRQVEAGDDALPEADRHPVVPGPPDGEEHVHDQLVALQRDGHPSA